MKNWPKKIIRNAERRDGVKKREANGDETKKHALLPPLKTTTLRFFKRETERGLRVFHTNTFLKFFDYNFLVFWFHDSLCFSSGLITVSPSVFIWLSSVPLFAVIPKNLLPFQNLERERERGMYVREKKSPTIKFTFSLFFFMLSFV